MTCSQRIGIVVPDPSLGYGVPTVAAFLYDSIRRFTSYTPALISVATSSRDPWSIRLLSPRSWFKGIQVGEGSWEGIQYQHVGCSIAELEFRRYMPRKALTNLLNDVDLVQVVAGTPAWAFAVKDVRVPIALQVASLVGVERASKLRTERALKRLWTYAMTRANSRLEALALQRVQAVFVENSWMFRAIRRVAPGAIVRFAPPGVDTDFFSPGGYARDGFILSVGRFSDPRKNVRLLLRAYARLVSTQRAVPDLVLVGKAAASHDLAVISELGIGTRVRVYEDVSREALRDFYRGARLFVLSSDEEGLGLVILEAMATGLPVVSTDCGGPRTLVVNGVTGLLTPTGDAEALANAMLLLLTDRSLAQRMGEAGRARAVRLFSMERASRRFFRVYEHLLQQKGGRHGAS